MTAQELVKLIKACKDSNVELLNFEGLVLRFKSGDAGDLMVNPDKIKPPTDKQLEVIQSEVRETQSEHDIRDILATLAIEDPVAFEDGVVQQEFVFNEVDGEETVND